jgi:hypothetical protein
MPVKAWKFNPFKRKTICKILLIFILGTMLQGQTVLIEQAHAVKAGQSCTKAGLKNGSYVCTKVKGRLIWQIVKKKQSISALYPTKINISASTVSIDFSSTSKLPINAVSLDPGICSLVDKEVQLNSTGYCTIKLSQLGNAQYLPAPSYEIKILVSGNNEISFNPLTVLSLTDQTYSLSGSSTSGLPLKFESLTPDICLVSDFVLMLVKVGFCRVWATQGGSEFFDPAQSVEATIAIQGKNQIVFTPLSSLLISLKNYQLSGTSTSGLSLAYASSTPEICSVSGATLTLFKTGTCTVTASQNGSNLYPAAQPITAQIVISGARVTSDQPDTVNGFQVKAIYVVPSDGIDHSFDTNGYIAGILDEGNAYLRAQIGLQVPIDKSGSGYDIAFMKTKFSKSYLLSASNLTDDLLVESLFLENPGVNRKDYIFFIDIDILRDGRACGYGAMPGFSSVVAVGTKCTEKVYNFNNYAAHAWPHELFHNFGVDHTPDNPCDFMRGPETPGTCPWNGTHTIDKERTRYVGSSNQGQDILKLPVWEGYTNKDYWSRCYLNPVPRADGFKYAYCPTGTQTIGALTYCWQSYSSVGLEEFVDGSWKSLGAGSHYKDPWGPNVTWSCNDAGYSAPWKQLTVTSPGISLYRWMRNGVESEQFKVIWVR